VTLETGSSCDRRLSPTRRCLNPSHGSVSDSRSSNRTCSFPASGSPTGFTAGPTRAAQPRIPAPHIPLRPPVQLPPEVRDQLGVHRHDANLRTRRSFSSVPEARPLPSTPVTGLPRYYEPLRRPTDPPPHAALNGATRPPTGPPTLQQRTVPTCHSHYPGGPRRLQVSVLHHRAAAFLPLERSRRPHLALSRPAQDSLALRPADLLGAPTCTFCLRGFDV